MSAPQQPLDPSAKPPEQGPTAIYRPQEMAADLVDVLDNYLADLQAGRAPDKARLLAEHPELAKELEECLAGIEFVHRAAKPVADSPTRLGDFRIIREVGRGGMGVVYEAEQLSLKRKVALKVLRFGITADAEVMKRFQREAETVAHLHHTNIVPIHAVGCEEGVHYYAMQFIEGRSLATVMNDVARDGGGQDSNRFRDNVQWALQAAEALAYAHQRGVIHRDVKPSNLILDPEGTVWLTDFGLAKRADEVTLTAAGVVMGTPRYMSPEQAAAAKQPIDHRTDIYSLGATLYELATGKPVFDSTTPQGVITQILNAEPVAPRLVQGTLPRDLETIILKCLAKEPAKRYQQARDLADDLRAFLENRPIRARRASLAERAIRWARKHRRSTMTSVISAAASLLLICGSLVIWNAYQESLRGELVLTTDGPTLVAEVLNDRDELVVPSFPVPTPQPVVVPAGAYRVRLSASGQMSETWNLEVERGKLNTFPVTLIDRMLAPPIEVRQQEAPQLVELDGQQYLFHRGEQGWRLVRGGTLKAVWPKDLGKFPDKLDDVVHPQTAVWNTWQDLLQIDNYYGETGGSPGVASTGADVNQDQHADLILASRVSPSLIAVSGVDGKVLWWYRALPVFPKDHDNQADPIDLQASSENAGVIGQPTIVDLNGEPVVIALFVSTRSTVKTKSGKSFNAGREFYVEAVAARSGKPLWRSKLTFEDFPNLQLSELLQIFPTQPDVVLVGGKRTVLLPLHTKLHAFDLQTGNMVWPALDLGGRPIQPPRYGDLNGDHSSDAMVVIPVSHTSSTRAVVKAISLTTGAQLWEHPFRPTDRMNTGSNQSPITDIVWITDMDLDGVGEVVVPDTDDWEHGGGHWYGIEVLHGNTGTTRWQRRLWTSSNTFASSGSSNGAVRMVVGPDLNGDGRLELFASSMCRGFGGEKPTLQIEALSGQDGRVVWRSELPGGYAVTDRKSQMQWWQGGDDGWPQLLVPVEGQTSQQPMTYAFTASTGRLSAILPEVADPRVVDMNGDGLSDLYYLMQSQGNRRLTVLKGFTPQNWRRPGTWRPGDDYDRDGITDYLRSIWRRDSPLVLEAASGQDEHALWEQPFWREYVDDSFLTSTDFDGDGISDIAGLETQSNQRGNSGTVVLMSGKDGKRLWAGPDLGLLNGSSSCSGGGAWCNYSYPFLDHFDLDRDGHPEILLAAQFDDGHSISLAAISGTNGKLLWKAPILAGAYTGSTDSNRHVWHDLNGDGHLDITLVGPRSLTKDGYPEGMEVRAINGRDGSELWKATGQLHQEWFLSPRPAIADVDGDGIPEVFVTTSDPKGWNSKAGGYPCEMVVLDGRNGQRKWTWPWTSGMLDLLPPLLVNLAGDGQRLVCLGVQETSPQGVQTNVIIISPTGELLKRIPVDVANSYAPWMALDIDQDGKEELLYRQGSELIAHRGLDQTAAWKWPVTSYAFRLDEYRRGTDAHSNTLVAWNDRTVYGLNPETGTARWRCDVPRLDGQESQTRFAWGKLPHVPPVVVTYRSDSPSQSTVTQQAWPVSPTGTYQPLSGKLVPFTEYHEPVRYRALPWRVHVFSLETIVALIFFVLLLRSAVCGRWRRVFLTLLAWGLVTSSVGWLALQVQYPLAEGEQYSREGWYGILIIGGSIMGIIMAVISMVGFIGRRLRLWLWGISSG